MTGDFINDESTRSTPPHPETQAVRDWINEWEQRAKADLASRPTAQDNVTAKPNIPAPESDEVRDWLNSFGNEPSPQPSTQTEFAHTHLAIVDPLKYKYSDAPSGLKRRFQTVGDEGPFIPEEADRKTQWRYEISQACIGKILTIHEEQERRSAGEDVNSAPIDIKTIMNTMTQNYMRIIQRNSMAIINGERQVGDLTFFDIHDLYCVLENMLFFARQRLDSHTEDESGDHTSIENIQRGMTLQDISDYTGLMNTIGTFIIEKHPQTQQDDHSQNTA